MQLFKTINYENVDETSISDWQYRKAARAVVFDNNNQIGLLYVKKKNYYKLPGGGVETGEDTEAALRRECKKELGVEIKIIKEVGGIVEYRSKWKLCQTSHCFVAKINSEKNNPNFTEKEKLSGFEIVWTHPNKALKLLNLSQTSDYEGKFIKERDLCFLNKALKETSGY